MDAATSTADGEIQVAPSILGMKNIVAHHVSWFDTGNEVGLQKARKHFKGLQNLDKLDEELYVVNDTVIKYLTRPGPIRTPPENHQKNKITENHHFRSLLDKHGKTSKNLQKNYNILTSKNFIFSIFFLMLRYIIVYSD